MPAWADWIVNILIVIVMLGVLIAIHEAGHLATAKAFHVYCFEYSIGMGPKLFSFKRKNGETKFTVRAIPFGGYVMMYGERGAVPDGVEEPPVERSLNAIKKWKKCIILVAGVTLNFILGLALIYVADSACPVYYTFNSGLTENKVDYTYNLSVSYDEAATAYIDGHKAPEYQAKDYVVSVPIFSLGEERFYLLSWDGALYNAEGVRTNPDVIYALVYSPSTLVDDHRIGDSIYVFPTTDQSVPQSLLEIGVGRVPVIYDADKNLNNLKYSEFADGVYMESSFRLIPEQLRKEGKDIYNANYITVAGEAFRLTIKNKAFTGGGIVIHPIKSWNSFGESWQRWAQDVPTACGAIVKGFVSLFTPEGFMHVGSIVAITAAMPQIRASGGARMVFFYAGMISINLAFFNLLPFPGLDGWSLTVTVVEGITKKKIPEKVQSIVSLVGIGLLLAFMAVVVVKDVIMLFV